MKSVKPVGVQRGSSASLPSGRTTSDRLFETGDRARDGCAFFSFVHQKMPDETVAVTTKIETGIPDRRGDLGIARERLGAGVDRERHAARAHQVDDAPEAYSRAIFEQRFSNEIPAPRRHLSLNAVGQGYFRGRVAIGNGRLRAFFDIENDRQRQPCAVRPAGIRRRPAVADEIAIVVGSHLASDATGKASPIFLARSSSN